MDLFPRTRLVIDAVRPDDADAMAEIHGEAFVRAWSPYDFAGLVSGANVFGIAARRESLFRPRRLVGFALVRSAADEAEVLTIAVRNAQRGKGLGRRLMEEVLRRLHYDRTAACFLEVDRDNASAKALYESLGFKAVGERKGYYARKDGSAGGAVVMRLELRRPRK